MGLFDKMFKDPRAVEALIPILSTQPFHYPHTREAARQALKSITGQDFGQDVEQWREWWASTPKC